jgi:capsular exopolysaccharide synthesis family protein
MTGEHRQDLRDIVNAVAAALMHEVVDKDNEQRRLSLEKLITLTREEEGRLGIKERQLAEQDAKIAVFGSDADAQKLADDRALRLQIRQELGQLKLQIIQYDVQRRVLRGMPVPTTDNQTPVEGEVPIDDDIFDVLFADDLQFRALLSSAKRKENELAMSKLRFSPDNPAGKRAIEEAESNHAVAADLLTKYRAEHQAAARERMRHMGSAETVGTDPAVLEQQIALMKATQKELEQELIDSESKEKDMTDYLIDRRKVAEEVAALKLRVKEKKDAIYARQTEMDNREEPVALYPAQTPTQPDTAKQIKMAGAAGFGLFGLIGGAIVWLEILTKRVSHVTDVEQQLHLQVIGSVPSMPRFAMKASNNGEKRAKAAYWHSVLTESIDSARTMLLRYAKTGRLKTVMIASATGGEGKTSVSCHLATSLARAGRRVLLMDCDIRRPSVNWVFGLENDTGFCELLCGLGTPDEAIQEAAVPGLYVLPAGHVNSDVLRNLAQENLGELIDAVSKDFDFVIIDTSPILPVTDGLMFAQHVDGILFSIRRDVSRMSKVQTAVQRLAMLGAPLIGAVAIGLDEGIYGARYHYNYRYNGYGYGHHPSHNGGNGELTTEVIEQGSA